MLNELTISLICTGRGGAYLDALGAASREELEAAEQRVRLDHEADFPMDAARRLDQIQQAMDSLP